MTDRRTIRLGQLDALTADEDHFASKRVRDERAELVHAGGTGALR